MGAQENELVPVPMIYSTMALSVFGVVGNILIVAATVSSKSLHSRCQFLIAVLAASDTIVCIHLVQLRVLMFQKWYMVTNQECFRVSFPGLFALNMQAGLGLVLGVDRLLAVCIPLRYPKLPKRFYAGMILLVVCSAAVITGKGWLEVTDNIVPVCLPPTAYPDGARKIWVMFSFALAVIVVVVYAVANFKCKQLSASNIDEESTKRTRRLLNSLTLVVAVYFFTWFLTITALVATVVLPLRTSVISVIHQQLAWLVIINSSSNILIYMWRSKEYRRVIVSFLTLGFLKNWNKQTNQVIAINSVQWSRQSISARM